ncbi:MAG TPA: sigma 54-interacting transcriptional regulator, partial [Erythrobacter sp.]|nr:sigma 54-interacting transcriptional regulator [Erythrobacter sp.]
FDLDELVHAVRQAVGSRAPSAADAVDPLPGEGERMPLVGRSPAMQGVYRMITRVLRNDLTVLITGESGTGKELVAEAIHQLGNRRTGPFVAVNTAAIPADLIESELFGHEKGAFTGAIAQAIGKFEQANGGTLFLDEIGDMPAEAQTRLLRALQSGRIRRVGGRQEIAVNVRIIAATNRDLTPMIAAGTFREDLFYRLNVVPIELPPLRERREDIAALAQHFLVLAAEDGLPRRHLTVEAVAQLEARGWRGNVRELRNVVYRLALMAREERIDADNVIDIIGPEIQTASAIAEQGQSGFGDALANWLAAESPPSGAIYHRALAAFEKPLIEYALGRTGGNQLRAAQLLGINRNTLRKRIGELGLEPDRFSPQ